MKGGGIWTFFIGCNDLAKLLLGRQDLENTFKVQTTHDFGKDKNGKNHDSGSSAVRHGP